GLGLAAGRDRGGDRRDRPAARPVQRPVLGPAGPDRAGGGPLGPADPRGAGGPSAGPRRGRPGRGAGAGRARAGGGGGAGAGPGVAPAPAPAEVRRRPFGVYVIVALLLFNAAIAALGTYLVRSGLPEVVLPDYEGPAAAVLNTVAVLLLLVVSVGLWLLKRW